MEDLLKEYLYEKKYNNSPNVKLLQCKILEKTKTYSNIGIQVILHINDKQRDIIDYFTISKKDYNIFQRRYKINKILKR